MTYTSQKTYFSTYINGESPYTITLDNDSATIGATADGVINNNVLQKVSAITVTVYHGNENITKDCQYSWTVEGGTLNNTNTNKVYFSQLTADTASATVSVRKNGQLLGEKSFSISKNKQGKQGEQGPQGAQGPQGPAGTFDEDTLNRDLLLGVLEEEGSSDGIIKVKGTDNKYYFGLNLDAIKTGALQIGDNKENAIFYANYKNPEVRIGGWLVSENALHTTEDALYLGTSTITATIGNTSGLELVFKAGSNFGVTSGGAMYASSGNIGGWEIGERTLSTSQKIGESDTFYMCSSGLNGGLYDSFTVAGVSNNKWRLAIGADFGVTNDGSLYCDSGVIGGFAITDYSLHANGFHILSGQQSTTEPRIKLGYSTKTFNGTLFSALSTSEMIKPVHWGSFEIPIPANLYNAIKKNRNGNGVTTGYYDAIIIDGTMIGITGPAGMDAKWTIYSNRKNMITIFSVLSTLDWKSPAYSIGLVFDYPLIDQLLPFWVTDAGVLHANQGEFDALITGGFTFGGNQGQQMTCVIKRPIDNGDVRLGISATKELRPFYLTHNKDTDAFFWIDWFGRAWFHEVSCNSGQFSGSDRNIKNTIATISDKYEKLFDNLRSVTHKYNDGTSDRLHVGFIAQEVDQAMQIAGLSRQEFAGLGIRDQGTDKEWWGLRYSEFVPINTWQIQKLKPRMTAAEEKIQQLELEVIELKQELTILKNQ